MHLYEYFNVRNFIASNWNFCSAIKTDKKEHNVAWKKNNNNKAGGLLGLQT
jgi:hypothetical protein